MIEFRYHTPEETEYITLSTEAVTLDDILEACERFLRACGFSLPEGAHIGYEYEDYLEGGKYPPPQNCKENTPEILAGTESYRHGGTRITDCDVKEDV